MSERQVLANQGKILRNQAAILRNQVSILRNQRKLDQVIRTQKRIEAKLARLLAR